MSEWTGRTNHGRLLKCRTAAIQLDQPLKPLLAADIEGLRLCGARGDTAVDKDWLLRVRNRNVPRSIRCGSLHFAVDDTALLWGWGHEFCRGNGVAPRHQRGKAADTFVGNLLLLCNAEMAHEFQARLHVFDEILVRSLDGAAAKFESKDDGRIVLRGGDEARESSELELCGLLQ